MAYIKKDIRELITSMDRQFTFGKEIKKWVKNNISTNHNLIIKTRDEYYCTNCRKIFYSKAKVGETITCPKCKNNFLVRSNRLKNYKYIDDFRILEFINGYFVIRGFEVLSEYNNFKFEHNISEYQRLVIAKDKKYLLFSNKFKTFIYSCFVNHYERQIKWRLHDNYYSNYYYSNGLMYLGNIEDDIKNSPYQYCNFTSPIIDYTKADSITLLQKILNNPTSYELLNKLGLTNLSIVCDRFNIKGSFEKRFGVPKEYLPFMVKHNITYDELKVLRVIRRKNIKLIRKLSTLNCFDELSSKLDMIKALDNGLNSFNEHIYRDYLNFAERLQFDMKDKRTLYPKDIIKAHDKLLKQVKDIEDKEMIENIIKRYEELKDKTYKNKKYIIYPVPSYSDLIIESKMQNNCVRSYNFRYANHEVDLYFMRLVSNMSKSLVTIEVRDNKVVQSRIKNNKLPSMEQLSFIKTWENKFLNT